MPEFYMLAGTLSTDESFSLLQTLLSDGGFELERIDDEILIKGQSNLTIRTGFDHEFIVVGDSTTNAALQHDSEMLSALLKQHQIEHEFEFYDMANEQYECIDYKPV